MAHFYDTHAHLDYPDFAAEMPELLARATDAGITKVVTIATNLDSSGRAIQLAEQFPNVFATIGWHPGEAMDAPSDIRPQLRELARHPKVVAIGETGLDHYRLPSQSGGTAEDDERYRIKQADLFQQQLEVAAECGRNVVIHTRDSLEPTLAQFQPFVGRVRAVFHCSLVSFTGIVTFKNAQTVRDTVAATPLDRLMVETDSPYLAPVPFRGKRCEPAYVRETAAMVAQVKGCSLEELSAATCRTAEEFFRGLKS
jgi:TatD DNase family protein